MPSDMLRPASHHLRPLAHEVHQRLQHERTSRLAQLAALKDSAPTGTDTQLAVQMNAIRRVLAEIEAAQSRLASDAYGTCQACGRPIPTERLEILPYARCCVDCQERTG
ncbi:TraR/DksA family transcriptional regulator [Streptomyces sp. NPDC001339]|uniref:TraR/DksA family transcriptional regulator n=1 Tax=Streptomyces sp. NPDC001339 TaxID=3364563 RepID=UPI0036CACDC4